MTKKLEVPPRPHRAAEYLDRWMHEYTGHQELPLAASHLVEVLSLVDEEYPECETRRDRQALLAVAAAATRFFQGTQGDSGGALLELYQGLVALANGEQGDHVLLVEGRRGTRRSTSKDWDIACVLVAYKQAPHRSTQIGSWVRRNMELDLDQILKMKANMEQADEGRYAVLRRHLEYIRAAVADGDDWMIAEIIG